MNLIADLQARKLIQDITPGTEEQLLKEMTTGYIGFDPTADSLHVGSLLQIILLMRLQRAGHKPVALVGGATGMVGDPSGRSLERNMLTQAELDHNCNGIRQQLEKFLDFDPAQPNAAEMVNNYDWFKDYSFLHFIRDAGRYLTVNYMLAKDSVQKRLETGMSFTEFSYQLIQGYDFYWLNAHKGVKLQMGGADQWGNITTGTELIRKMTGGEGEAFAFTSPLVTKSDGAKFGKSESGNVWLDAARTSPYAFYQFWMKMSDADAERLVYVYSFKPVAEITALIEAHREAPHRRLLQKSLAEEITLLVHGEAELQFAQQASDILFSNTAVEALRRLNEQQLLEVMEGVPQATGLRAALEDPEGMDLITFLADRGVFSSKGEARKMIQNGGLSINKEKITDTAFALRPEHLLNERYVLIQKGKGNYTLAVFA